MTAANGERIHVTEKNARDTIDFLRGRPKNRSFSLTVGFFAGHAEDKAPEQYLPQDWSAKAYEGVRIPPPLRGEPQYKHPTITSKDRIPSSQGVMRQDWKYIEWPEFDYQQLFDLQADPGEIRNLAGQPAHAGRQVKMRKQLDGWRQRVR